MACSQVGLSGSIRRAASSMVRASRSYFCSCSCRTRAREAALTSSRLTGTVLVCAAAAPARGLAENVLPPWLCPDDAADLAVTGAGHGDVFYAWTRGSLACKKSGPSSPLAPGCGVSAWATLFLLFHHEMGSVNCNTDQKRLRYYSPLPLEPRGRGVLRLQALAACGLAEQQLLTPSRKRRGQKKHSDHARNEFLAFLAEAGNINPGSMAVSVSWLSLRARHQIKVTIHEP